MKFNPMLPPTVDTIGDEKFNAKLPLAKFTVAGPAASNGDGPEVPRRWSTRKLLTHSGRMFSSM